MTVIKCFDYVLAVSIKNNFTTNVWLSILIATIGIVIMALGDFEKGSLIGFMFGIISSIGFSVFSVTFDSQMNTDKQHFNDLLLKFIFNL